MERRILLSKCLLVLLLVLWGNLQGQVTNAFPETGDVGIGTTSPSTPLHVIGESTLDGNDFVFTSCSVFPNPASDKITILGISLGDRILISDMMGRVTMEFAAATDFEMTFGIASLHPGAYLITVSRSEKVIARLKMIVNP